MLPRSPEPEARDKLLGNNQDRIGIWKCWFLRRGEDRRTRRKTSRSRVENQQQIKLNPHMTPGPGIEPRTHWWEASSLTTAASPAPLNE